MLLLDLPQYNLNKFEGSGSFLQEFMNDTPLEFNIYMMKLIFLIAFIIFAIFCTLLSVFYFRFKMYCQYIENKKRSKFHYQG